MAIRSKRRAAVPDWIGLHEASELLGISASTLRRWSDAGVVQTFVTPGGHRRFSRAAVMALLPTAHRRPTMERLGETPERMSRVYRRTVGASLPAIPWLGSLTDEQRALFREHGRLIAGALLEALDAPDDAARAAHLAGASRSAAEYGRAAAIANVPASVAVQVFLRFRRPFLGELSDLGRRRGLDTTAVTELIDGATDAFDELLVATVRGQEAALLEARRARRAARSAAASERGLALTPPGPRTVRR